jgi:ABC-type branched-subunit amino acid transport system substrate-binding protein
MHKHNKGHLPGNRNGKCLSATARLRARLWAGLWALSLAGALGAQAVHAEDGVTESVIRVGGVMDLKGDSRGLGEGMRNGIEAAFKGVTVKGRSLKFTPLNDNYSPSKTIESTVKLLDEGVFIMLGNVGTPTAKVSLPILAEKRVPAVGFFTGAGILRPGVGDIVNFRASYVQETAAVISSALDAGLKPTEICAFVQNDAYGMAGVAGIKRALSSREGTETIIPLLDEMMAMDGASPPRNNVGPVGVYQRNTLYSRDGYDSLKNWEAAAGTKCRLVVSVGTYTAIARFAAYSRNKGDDWFVSAVSFTGADNFKAALNQFNVKDRVIMTQVVPPLDSDLPIVGQARKALGDDFGYVSLEGYIVGKLFIAAVENINGPVTREGFMKAIRGKKFDIGGLTMDFTRDNQGSDMVALTYLNEDGYRPLKQSDW